MADIITVPHHNVWMNSALSETIFNMTRPYGVKSTLNIKEHNDTVFLFHDMRFNLVDQGGGGSLSRTFGAEAVLLFVERSRGNLPVDMPDT